MRYVITKHAVERYIERCRGVGESEARRQIAKLIGVAQFQPRAPDWAQRVKPHSGALVAGDVALILQGRTVVTLITRGTIPPEKRERRRRNKKDRKARLARRRGV